MIIANCRNKEKVMKYKKKPVIILVAVVSTMIYYCANLI